MNYGLENCLQEILPQEVFAAIKLFRIYGCVSIAYNSVDVIALEAQAWLHVSFDHVRFYRAHFRWHIVKIGMNEFLIE